ALRGPATALSPIPSTPRFRSHGGHRLPRRSLSRPWAHGRPRGVAGAAQLPDVPGLPAPAAAGVRTARSGGTASTVSAAARIAARSEEHTSELQSRENLLCRLL